MKVSKTVAYAVHATVQLAQSDSSTPVPCSRLASQGNMPERFLLQILRDLVARGILRSTRGVDGGYALNREADDVSLLDLIEALEGPLDSKNPIGEGLPKASQEKLQDAIVRVTETSKEQLAAIKISHLIPPPKPKKNKR